jgi:hypothetical protein
MSFSIRFVASDEAPVAIGADDAGALLEGLGRNFRDDDLGIPHLVGRLEDGRANGTEITIDEREAREVLVAIESIEVNGGTPSEALEALRRTCRRYAP